MNKKRLLSVVGLVVLGSISWIWAYALNINSSSFDAWYPIFKKIIFSLLGSENSPIGVQIDENGIYLSSSALPGTAGNIIKVGSDDKFIKSTIQNWDIGSGSIGPQHIATGGVTNQDIGNLQISNHHILINSLNTWVFASDINFVSGGLFYFANGVCQGSNGISAIANGAVVCSPLPNLWSGWIGWGCIEWQTPVMDENWQWTCQWVLLGSEWEWDMYWNGNNGYTCTKWFNGCNTCEYDNPDDPINGSVMCTQRYCQPSEYTDAYCINWFSWYTTWVNNAFTYTGIKDIWNANQTTPGFVWVGLTTPTETLQAAQDVRVDNNTDANGIGEVYCHKTDSWVPSSMYDIATCATCAKPWFVYNPSTNVCEKIECSNGSNNPTESINWACGSSNGGSFTNTPVTNLCSAWTPVAAQLSTDGTSWEWMCSGINGGYNTYCWADYTPAWQENGACGSTNGQTLNTTPTTNLCSAGLPTAVVGNGPWSWTCQGTNTTAACSANKVSTLTNAVCGSANGTPTSTAPINNLCSVGIASTVNGGGTANWSWTCQWLNGGANASCSAPSSQSTQETYTWDIGSWSPCNITSSCQWTYTTPGACGFVGQEVAWSIGPGWELPGPYEWELCRIFTSQVSCNRGWLTHSCSWRTNLFSTNSCEGVNEFECGTVGPYKSCSLTTAWGTQMRGVVCKNSQGNMVADSLCPQPKPATSQPCSWGGTAWSCTLDTTTWPWCFIAGTVVTLADGSKKAIENIKVGDKLKAVKWYNTVIALIRPLLGNQDVYAINNTDAFFTANHPFLTTEWWKSLDPETTKKEIPDLDVNMLHIGDILITDKGNITITTISHQKADKTTQLYNFELDWDHTYYANWFAVHNKYAPGTPNPRIGMSCTYNNQCFSPVGWEYLACDNDSKTCQDVNFASPNYVWDGCG